MAAHLEIIEGPDAGSRLEVSSELELGREGRGFQLADPLSSRHHARLTVTSDALLYVEDIGSTNGTFLNGNEVHSPTRLEVGDHVLIGASVIEVQSDQQAQSLATSVRPIPPGLAMAAEAPRYIPDAVARPTPEHPSLDPLLDVHVKHGARTAPIALFALACLVVVIYLAVR